MERVRDKVAIVTGSARGIGKTTAETLAREGAKVAVVDLIEDEGQETVRGIIENGFESKVYEGDEENGFIGKVKYNKGIAQFWRMDVTSEESVRTVFKEVYEIFGRIDVLVNNAGIVGIDMPTHEFPLDEWKKIFDVNVHGVFLCTKHVIPYMQENGSGSIINISSTYGIRGTEDVPPYHASKGAVRIMTKTDAVIYAKDKIRVNSVHPSFVWTPMVQADAEKFAEGGGEAAKKFLADKHPLKCIADPEDIANGILYLAGDESKFTTGLEFAIDGGFLL